MSAKHQPVVFSIPQENTVYYEFRAILEQSRARKFRREMLCWALLLLAIAALVVVR